MQKLPPLPINFYDRKAWHATMLDFYDTNPKFPSKEALDAPIKLLTSSIGNIIDITKNPTPTPKIIKTIGSIATVRFFTI